MGFFDLFSSKDTYSRKEYIKQLIKVAKADGNLDESEYRFIQKVASRLETSEAELDELHDAASTTGSKDFHTSDEKFQFLWDLVWVMTADHEIDVNEVHICCRMASKLGYPPEIVKRMSEHIQLQRSADDSPEDVYNKALSSFDL